MFKQYSAKVHDLLNAYFQTATRIDLVFDVYIENSLKAVTRAEGEEWGDRLLLKHQFHQTGPIFLGLKQTSKSFFYI